MAWNLGRLAAVRRARALIERAESARVAVLEERARIARETHDIVAHSLAVIVRQAEEARSWPSGIRRGRFRRCRPSPRRAASR
jgi:signal transduction histidine kinase